MRRALLSLLLMAVAWTSSGCVAVLAGAGGTVAWQGGKVISEERVTVDRAVAAVKAVFKAKKIRLTEEVTKRRATQIRGEDSSGANVAVDVILTGPKSCRIEIRVGLGDKSASRQLLDEIKNRF